jgi:coenzyme Q-binding protein COQ10
MRYRDSTRLPYSCEAIFQLLADIERYPEFLPGWQYARIKQRKVDRLYVDQHVRLGPAVFRFSSTAVLEPYSRIHIKADSGPFRHLDISWCISPAADDHCLLAVELDLAYRPGPGSSALLMLFRTGGSRLLPLFEQRARTVYR